MTTRKSSYKNSNFDSTEDIQTPSIIKKINNITQSETDTNHENEIIIDNKNNEIDKKLESTVEVDNLKNKAVKRSYKPRKNTKKSTSLELTIQNVEDKKSITVPNVNPIENSSDRISIPPLVAIILKAIQENKAIELYFKEPEVNPSRMFEPRQIMFDTFAKDWYIWGWDRRYNTERHHLISLISRINLIDGIGRIAQGCNCLDNVQANSIGGWFAGETIHIKVILLKQWVFAVRQAPIPFPEFKIEDLEDGKAQITFIATDLKIVARWVMQFGDGIQIIEPQRLADRIRQVGLTWSNKTSTSNNTLRNFIQRQENKLEHKMENKSDYKNDLATERKSIEQFKPYNNHRDTTEGIKTTKIEIRIDRL